MALAAYADNEFSLSTHGEADIEDRRFSVLLDFFRPETEDVPPEPTRVENVMLRLPVGPIDRDLEGERLVHVSVEIHEGTGFCEVLACVAGSRAVCGYGESTSAALQDLVNSVHHDFLTLADSHEDELTRDAKEHIEFLRSLLDIS